MIDRAADMRHILSQVALLSGGTVMEAAPKIPAMSKKSLGGAVEGILPATPENIERARAFVFKKWLERFAERYPTLAQNPDDPNYPRDLSDSCKFTSLFARTIFGGQIQGNDGHQFVKGPDGQIIDLNIDAADVKAIADRHAKSGLTGWHEDEEGFLDYHGNPHDHNPVFFGNRDHLDSMKSVVERVQRWVNEFCAEMK